MNAPRRRRRSAEAAREEILDAAEQLLIRDGPTGVRIRAVAELVGISHPGVLHHFGTAEALLEELYRRASRRAREELLALLPVAGSVAVMAEAIDAAMERISDPRDGRLLASLVASGRDPFPAEEERGLQAVAASLHAVRPGDGDLQETKFIVMTAALAMFGDALVGAAIRRRLGLPDDDPTRAAFRRWLGALLADRLLTPAAAAAPATRPH